MKKFFISIVLLFCFLAGYSQSNSNIRKLGEVFYYLDKMYLDTLNFPDITDKAIISIVRELDPHSSYLSAEEVKEINIPLMGSFYGIGVEFAILNDTILIQSVIVDGPSEKVGIRAGDKVIKVNGEIISGTGLTIQRIHKYFRGEKGSKVNISILRSGRLLDFEITRDKVSLNSVDASYLVEDEFIYIRLTRFAINSHKEVIDAISAKNIKPKGLILDLRGNSGGYLASAIDIANEFLHKGNLIVYLEGRKIDRRNEYADGNGRYKDVPIVVLVDKNSASASEIIAGALQDWDRGTIVGERTFGKGLVQQQLPLKDGSMLRLTVARYHTPTGRVIQKPYQMGKKEEYYNSLDNNFFDSLKYNTLKLGRTVYGGGGIMPDIIIEKDTSFFTPFYEQVVQKGIIYDFVNEYTFNNKEYLLKKYPSYNDFKVSFIIPDNIVENFIAFCKNKEIIIRNKDYDKSINEIKKYLKGIIIKNLYGFSNLIEFINSSDSQFIKAIEVLKDMHTKKG